MSIIVENPDRVNQVEMIVGIPSYKEADSIAFPTDVSSRGLLRYFSDKKSVIINVDNNSPDGTKDVFDSVHIDKMDGLAVRGWIVSFMLSATKDLIDSQEGAENYLEIDLGSDWHGFSVVIQRTNKLSPAGKATQLQTKVDILEDVNAELRKRLKEAEACLYK